MSKTFVDCHCHLFNLMDVPLYETLSGQVNVGSLLKLVAASSLGPAAGIIASSRANSLLKENEYYVKFFERSIENNIKWLQETVKEAALRNGYDTVLLIPLVMDFDCIGCPSEEDCEKNGLPKCQRASRWDIINNRVIDTESLQRNLNVYMQLERMQKAIKVVVGDDPKFKICPFIGFDLRRLTIEDNSGFEELKAIWNNYGYKNKDGNGSYDMLKSGQLLGIKLYPPIGFCPYPKSKVLRELYKNFFAWCIEENIPITVHCQKGSYRARGGKKALKARTKPFNWLKLLGEPGGKFSRLKINFAHFGGDEGLEDLVDFGIDKDCWTYDIIKLLQRHPYTYADLSAYEFSNSGSRHNLRKVIKWAKEGKFRKGAKPLLDKILWGSDLPLIISGEEFRSVNGYSCLYDNFKEVIDDDELVKRMTEALPFEFLFGKNKQVEMQKLTEVDERIIRYKAENAASVWADIMEKDDLEFRSICQFFYDISFKKYFSRVLAPLINLYYDIKGAYDDESDFLAEQSGGILSEAQMAVVQRAYTWVHMGCSTICKWDEEAKSMLCFRSLDWAGAIEIGKATRKFIFTDSYDNEVFQTAGIVGMLGVLTGVKPGFSVTINYAPWKHCSASFESEPTFKVRELLEDTTVNTYREAVENVMSWQTGAPVFITLCGKERDEACVIEIARNDDKKMRVIQNGLLVQTNHFSSGGDPDFSKHNTKFSNDPIDKEGKVISEWYDGKLLPSSKIRKAKLETAFQGKFYTTESLVKKLLEQYRISPVWNYETAHWVMMRPATGKLDIWARR